jgi:hypothetical protein
MKKLKILGAILPVLSALAVVLPGGHDWGEWDSQLPGCFESLLLHIKPAR